MIRLIRIQTIDVNETEAFFLSQYDPGGFSGLACQLSGVRTSSFLLMALFCLGCCLDGWLVFQWNSTTSDL